MAIEAARLRPRAMLAAAAATGLLLTACGGVQTSTGSGSGDGWPSGTVEMYVGASAACGEQQAGGSCGGQHGSGA